MKIIVEEIKGAKEYLDLRCAAIVRAHDIFVMGSLGCEECWRYLNARDVNIELVEKDDKGYYIPSEIINARDATEDEINAFHAAQLGVVFRSSYGDEIVAKYDKWIADGKIFKIVEDE